MFGGHTLLRVAPAALSPRICQLTAKPGRAPLCDAAELARQCTVGELLLRPCAGTAHPSPATTLNGRLRRGTPPVRRPSPPSTDACGAAPPRSSPVTTLNGRLRRGTPRSSPVTTLNGRLRRSVPFATGSIHRTRPKACDLVEGDTVV
ncbi:hypothetical protein GCM10027590_15270 [Nocardiopsis nanhaiensis]